AAAMAEALGREAEAPALRTRARRLQERFEADFWLPDQAFYALALDREGAPCRVISSNPGHLLWTHIVSDSRAQIVTRRLMQDDMFTGWGLRTLASGERLYNPMSYHNGSVWPHDTALAAARLAHVDRGARAAREQVAPGRARLPGPRQRRRRAAGARRRRRARRPALEMGGPKWPPKPPDRSRSAQPPARRKNPDTSMTRSAAQMITYRRSPARSKATSAASNPTAGVA